MESRIDQLREDIARRIRPLMPNIPDEEFTRLVAQMAELQYKYETRTRNDFFGTQGTR